MKSGVGQLVFFLLVLWYPAYQGYLPDVLTSTFTHLYAQALGLLPADLAQQAAMLVEDGIAVRQDEDAGAASIAVSVMLALGTFLLWNALRERSWGLSVGALVLVLMAAAWGWDADVLTIMFAASAAVCGLQERTDLQYEFAQVRRRRPWYVRLGWPRTR